tara:strand:+ start:2861 stop:5836 length:2976 start_codon:yes stop_codon:yes gene_type:complete
MSARKFKFISPGVFLNEIDNSQLPNEPREIGPLFIGRAKYGPAMRPVTVDSFAEFVQLYGEPIPGGKSNDVWRNGNEQTPTYGAYASQAWLRNSSTCTYMRLLGSQNVNASTAGKAGYRLEATSPLGLDIQGTPDFEAAASGNPTGSAYGLFVFTNQLSGTLGAQATGSLVATWYVADGMVGLVGNESSGVPISRRAVGSGSARLIAADSNDRFTVMISGSEGSYTRNRVISFSLSEANQDYIRNVFNTNPTLTNATITKANQRERYWLGETYATEFLQKTARNVVSGSGFSGSFGDSSYVGVVLPLATGSSARHSNRQIPFENGATRNNPATGYVFGQDLGGASAAGVYEYDKMTKLFRIHALDHAEWAQNNIKISIANINYSQDQFNKYGTFDVLVRRANDTDAAPIVIERFSNCNLDANSLDYVARKIGDQHLQFNTTTRRLQTRGEYPNNSKYIRIEMESDSFESTELLPFGFYGPLKYKDFSIAPATNLSLTNFGEGVMALGAKNFLAANITGSTTDLVLTGSGLKFQNGAGPELKFLYPSHELRISGNQDGLADQTDAFWGVWTGISKTSGKFNRDYADLNRNRSDIITAPLTDTAYSEHQFVFTLDELSGSSAISAATAWVSGSRKSGAAISSKTGNTYKNVIDLGFDRFTMPMFGGSDGLNITEKDPFRNTYLDDGGNSAEDNYAYNTIKEAIDIARDPEFVPYNLISVPGVTNEQLTTHLVNTAEARADALAVIDLKGDFQPAHEATAKVYPDLSTTVTNLKSRQINSSYGCAYYPFVQIRDTLKGQLVYMPASVAAIGAFSYTDRVRAPWFAPAGFNRGGLSSGVAGLPVVNVTEKLTAQDRDTLYDANINPIASFPNEGIVIFGQKTLQVTRSALDRINVRRLLIFIKKGISNIAAGVLFEPNVRATWARFIGQANPFLSDVQARFGLDEFKLVLDETTTTPDLIDRNILYAKVYLKPTRAIEFVAVDFIITNTGASFED